MRFIYWAKNYQETKEVTKIVGLSSRSLFSVGKLLTIHKLLPLTPYTYYWGLVFFVEGSANGCQRENVSNTRGLRSRNNATKINVKNAGDSAISRKGSIVCNAGNVRIR